MKHYLTKYVENGTQYAESWLQINLFGKAICFWRKRIVIGEDVVEVVRCEDCKYSWHFNGFLDGTECDSTNQDFYCARGKRQKRRNNMKKIIKGSIIITIAIIALTACRPIKVHAKTVKKYATQTVALRKNHKTVYKVKRNTKLIQIKYGKKWCKVKYKGGKYLVRKKFLSKERSPKKYTGSYFRKAGVIWWRDRKYTWYSQSILPGYGLKIPGRHLDSQGFVCDKRGYIVLGSNTANRGKIVATPFGRFGKVYDAGYVGTYWFDCYMY